MFYFNQQTQNSANTYTSKELHKLINIINSEYEIHSLRCRINRQLK